MSRESARIAPLGTSTHASQKTYLPLKTCNGVRSGERDKTCCGPYLFLLEVAISPESLSILHGFFAVGDSYPPPLNRTRPGLSQIERRESFVSDGINTTCEGAACLLLVSQCADL